MDEFWVYTGTGGTIEEAVREVVDKYDTGQCEKQNCNPFAGLPTVLR